MAENHSGSRGGNRSGNRGGNSRGGFHGGNRSGRPGQGGNGGGHGHYGHFGHSDHSNHTDHFGKGGQRGFKRYDHNDHKNRYDRDRSDRSDRYDRSDRGFRPRRHDDEGRRGYGDRRDGRRGNRFDDRRDGDRRDDRRAERRGNHYEARPGRPFDKRERGNHQGRQSSSNYDNGRRNSDGTVSYPSQNPYTDRRPGEPKMPAGMEWSMLSKEEKERLRGLSKEHAENIGLHMLAAFALEESDPEAALDHAKWIAKQASRIDMTRETLALIAYRMGDYRLALREFRTAFRMNGYGDYLPFMADCERGLGNPKKAIEIATSEDARYLQGESKAELFLVYAGALADLGKYDEAIKVAHTLAHAQGVGGAYRMRAVQAEQYFNEEAGDEEAAMALEPLLDSLEARYADDENDEVPEEDVVDNDMESITDDMLRGMGIDPEDFYAHHDEDDEPEPEPEAGPETEVNNQEQGQEQTASSPES
ncbi:tetratricopeptide repeat protein [Parascardovia denticolens]|uniref:tetratricopeptide repeat protein n=1 Tax=Parascardovia denticolens TaxID=78258 RepID=UPI00248E648F|nr:hypothetical protein [Parascardovia denticolens]